MEACKYYFEKTGRRITFEYSLVKDVNDTNEDVIQLTKLIKGLNCHGIMASHTVRHNKNIGQIPDGAL